MYVLFVKVKVKPEFVEQYLQATATIDARGSVANEPGCLRFDVIRDEADPTAVYFYEVYRDREAFEAHIRAPHFIQWRETVKDWTAGPGEVVRGWSYFPADIDWQKQPL
ncbi:MAG: antibiotic biosynthesis monooxygenase [Chloroflexota bacterium]